MISRWRDKTVNYISTELDEMLTYINECRQEQFKPIAIVKYNAFMKSVDLRDHILSYYHANIKCACLGSTRKFLYTSSNALT